MAAYQFANAGQSYASAPIAAGDTSLTLQGISTFSAAAQFVCRLDDPNVVGKFEFILVAAAPSGSGFPTVIRGVEGTSAQSFPAGAVVTQIVSAGTLNAAFLRVDGAGAGQTTTDDFGLRINPSVTAAGDNRADGITQYPTLTAHANNDVLSSETIGVAGGTTSPVFAKGAFTGLTAQGLLIDAAQWTATGAGTIATAYGLRVTSPSIGTLNIGARIDGLVGFGTDPSATTGTYWNQSVTATTANTSGIEVNGTLTAHANSDTLAAYGLAYQVGYTYAKGAFTGLTTIGLYVNGAGFAATGAGTIATAYGLRVTAPTIGTVNMGARIDGFIGFGLDVRANTAITFGPSITATAATTAGIEFGATVTAHANSDSIMMLSLAATGVGSTFAKSTFTGLTAYGFFINGPSFGQTGTGTIANAYGLYISAPTIGTTNYAARFDGLVDINNSVALGGGAAPTLGTIGGTGPAAAAQNSWLKIAVAGAVRFIPLWA